MEQKTNLPLAEQNIVVSVKLKRKGGKRWEAFGSKRFAALPRTGEFVEVEERQFQQKIDVEDNSKVAVFRVAAVLHPLHLSERSSLTATIYLIEVSPVVDFQRSLLEP